MFNTQYNIPRPELENRFQKLQLHMTENNIDGTLIMQNTDLYYFSGTAQQGQLYIPAKGTPLLMIQKDLERAAAESLLDNIFPISSPSRIPECLQQNGMDIPRRLGLELDVLPTLIYFKMQQLFPETEILDISGAIRLIRAIKSDWELDVIKEAALLADQVAEDAGQFIREGIPEIELAGKIEANARRLGHQGIIRMRLWGSELFYGHLMAGESAAVPSYLSSPTGGAGVSTAIAQGPGHRPIQRNEPILVDYVFALRGYLADHTRIFSIGELPKDLTEAYEAMLAVQEMVKKIAVPGISAGDVYEAAIQKAAELGYADNFMGVGESRIRFIGHGVGLELDEFPFLAKNQKLKLQKNMVIALEPKLIFPGKGVVGIENTHVVTENGLHQLTKFNEKITVL
ncbi:MAG: Xaa-Pro peptidase family protein [Pseudomonadota bacterium]